jgi:hypothetical protein
VAPPARSARASACSAPRIGSAFVADQPVPVGGEDVPLFEVMRTMRAMRRLKPGPVPDELLERLVEAARGRRRARTLRLAARALGLVVMGTAAAP